MTNLLLPKGFRAVGWHVGIKETKIPTTKEDFGVLFSDYPTTSYSLFTQNRYPGNPIIVGKKHIQNAAIRLIVVNSGNANVANGNEGLELAEECCLRAAKALNIEADQVLPSSTGVIGRPMPASKILNACDQISDRLKNSNVQSFVKAILTTDQYQKAYSIQLSSGPIVTGIAKGAGMIEPNMATMLAYMVTDATIESDDLKRWLYYVASVSLNRISVDSDTSTSDTFALLANGASRKQVIVNQTDVDKLQSIGYSDFDSLLQMLYSLDKSSLLKATSLIQSWLNNDLVSAEFMAASLQIALFIARQIVADGEGATRSFRVIVHGASDKVTATKIGRSIVNSPLVKTAVKGADPNWGRILMAVGKVFDVSHFDLQISIGRHQIYPEANATLNEIEQEMKNKEVDIIVKIGDGSYFEIFYGCDLTEAYVQLNSEYTT
ncbi:MAG: bifunctional ornithine acetyltransferase/N-acetylglutamate synthase [Leptonema sp. (in: Bacteria)]|nr:bifunctional ornithine acetyltransferase/N-acetylglutamate synthase [Leptonema sp. (in: bacteria)]